MNNPTSVLQTVFNVFTAQLKGMAGFELPRQQFIQTGSLAYDTEQFAVHAVSVYQGSPGLPRSGYQDATGGFSFYSMDVGVTITRNQPLIDNAARIPLAADLTKASMRAADDATALTNAYNNAMAEHSLAPACDNIYFGGITWIGPQGGMLGTMLNLALQL